MKILRIPESRIDSLNTNNIWKDGKRPIDYDEKSKETRAEKWIMSFHKDVLALDLTKHIRWIKEAVKIGKITGSFPEAYREELEDLDREYAPLLEGREWFVRTGRASLKTGYYGIGPYKDVSKIIISIVTSTKGHLPFVEDDNTLLIYFLPWKNLSYHNEYRVFVYGKKITSISQQHLYDTNIFLEDKSDFEIERIINRITEYFEIVIKSKINLDNYVYDFAFTKEDEPYFIEINAYGEDYGSGSALFEWVKDKDILEGRMEAEFRWR